VAQTATRTKSAKPAVHTPQIFELEIGKPGKKVLDELANARQNRLNAERAENPLKVALKEFWAEAAEQLAKGDQLVIKASGVVRGRVTLRDRQKQVDLDLLLQAFPEAYAACVADNFTPQFDPA
jgi:hypothetical protein